MDPLDRERPDRVLAHARNYEETRFKVPCGLKSSNCSALPHVAMRTVDSQIETSSLWGRLRRDIKLIRRLLSMVLHYRFGGERIRRVYRNKEVSGDVYWVDQDT